MGESTMIDSIQIEIQSNSTNASTGIDDLAGALGRLKQNTISKTAISNLHSLGETLRNFPNVHGASNALRTLANSIEKLKGVGTVSSLNKSLTALPASLETLKNIDLTGVSSQATAVASAFAPLSSMKAGGLGTLLRNLSKLEDVTNDLDNTKIANFAAQVKKVADAVAPLSQKMATIKEGFRGLNTVVKQTNTSLARTNNEVHTGMFNFANFTTVLYSVVNVIQQVARGFAKIINTASEWDGISARFGKGFGSQAQETYEWIQRLNEEMGINVQQFMQYSSVYATMLTGFGVANEDAGKMALGYAELTYDVWAGYNDIYKTFEEAADAVRSAIAGEVEPIRRAGFTIVEATLKQTAANHGLEISLENATEAQKSYLRYLTLVDQAHSQNLVGTYAKEMNTAEGLMRTLSQQLKSLGQAFGSLFIPMLVKALPYVQAFVELLTEGVYWLANLFGIEIQDISGTWGDYNSGISDAVENTEDVTGALNDATKAAKELKNASIGIDELNVISPPSSSSGSGSGTGAGDGFDGLDIDSLWDESIFDSVQSKVDSIKEKLGSMFDEWLPELQIVGGALAGLGLTKLLTHLGEALKLSDDFMGKVDTMKKAFATAIIVTLQFSITKNAFEEFMGENGTLWDYILGVATAAVGTYLLKAQWGAGGLVIGLGITAVASLSAIIEEGGITDVESLVVALTGLASGIGAIAIAWKSLQKAKFMGELIAFFDLAKEFGVIATLATTFPKLGSVLTALPAVFSAAGSALLAAGPWIALAAAVVGGITLAFVDYDFTEIGHTVGKKIGEAIRSVGGWVADVAIAIFEGIKSAIAWVKEAIASIDFIDVLEFLFIPGEARKRIMALLEPVYTAIVDYINEKNDNLQENIKEFFRGLFSGFAEGLGLDPSWGDTFIKVFEAAMNPRFIGEYIMGKINEGISANAKANALKDKLVSMWDTAKNWWNTKGNLSTYTPSIGDISKKLSSAWETAKTWWSKNRGSLSTYTPSIGKIWEKLKSSWETAKTWWSKNRSNLSYTPSIGSISSKLSSAWTTAKNWWNKSRSSLSYTPSIGSIKDKLVSAWNTAKSWWNKSVGSLSTKLNISIPKISVKWGEVSALGKTFKYPTGFKLDYAAEGGIFDQGSLIWAGERGPEILANATGGKTGVMNVEQMQEAVYEGVYAAITAAMSGRTEGGAQEVNVYLDGKKLTGAVEKYQRERGVNIMGNGAYSY